ncbi:hypothetical protein [Crenothrix polyspora]|uniref:Uncharacterized protein n=1 Tax=Crenothrix polyspora TaxID=360316 RepID=A0A1R4H9S5_9GAMM|nr:hypothetical protein [Crenothrix polyspora]SJM92927.1 exported hypothetical protein [Crenothrix polyspora]
MKKNILSAISFLLAIPFHVSAADNAPTPTKTSCEVASVGTWYCTIDGKGYYCGTDKDPDPKNCLPAKKIEPVTNINQMIFTPIVTVNNSGDTSVNSTDKPLVTGIVNPAFNLGGSLWPVIGAPQPGWIITGGGVGVLEGYRYNLYNTDQNAYLRFQDRAGVNLGWSNAPNGFMAVKRQYPSNRPITCEEPFGLFIEKEWPMYEKQTFGINLSTRTRLADTSWYQWRFTKCGVPGSVVQLNKPVALVNNRTNSEVVGCERLVGVNLCWAEDVITFKGKNYRLADARNLVAKGMAAVELLPYLP